MTQDEIIEMAIEARLAFDSEEYPEIWQTYMNVGKQEIEAFAKLVAAKEREALAQRTWVGLTDEEIAQGWKESWVTEQAWQSAVWWAEDKLKERNT
jgi:hypothetical protein